MLARLPVLASVGIALFQSASAQTTTMSVFPEAVHAVEDLQGRNLGAGAEGTTYEVSGLVSAIPVTATVVLGSTYVSQIFGWSSQGEDFEFERECSLDAEGGGFCTETRRRGEGGLRIVGSAEVTFASVAIDLDAPNANRAVSSLPTLAAVVTVAPLLGFIVAIW